MATSGFEDIKFQVIWNRLLALVEEQARTLMKTAFSPVVRESGDLSAGLFDPQGRMLAQAITGTPGHVNSMAESLPHFLRAYPLEQLQEGDHLITNDPWLASGHLHDITVLSPVFFKGSVVGFFGCTCHQLDIGGLGQGPDAKSVFEEGLYIPIMKLVEAGEPNQDLLKIIRCNVRTPHEVQGDILSYVSSNETSGERLRGMMQEFDLDSLNDIGEQILERSQAAMIEEIRKLPNGTTRNEITLDGYDEPVTIVCEVTVNDEDIQIDYTGSSTASPKGINLVLNYTKAYSNFGVRCLVASHVPNNAGSLAPITISAPEGSILNVQHPWPVCARHIIGQFLPDAVMGCLAQIIPGQVPSEGSSCLWGVQVRGGAEIDAEAKFRRDDEQKPYEILFFNSGGSGARPTKDGLSGTAFPSGVKAMSIEIVENMGPVVVWRKELRPDSGGAGKWRGGLGQIVELGTTDGGPFSLFAMFDRTNNAAFGREGGEDGALGKLRVKNGNQLNPKGQQLIGAGDRIELLIPGGGGYGTPSERAYKLVESDLRDGLVSS